MKKYLFFLFAILATNLVFSQISVIGIEKVNLPEKVYSYNAKFSPDGKSLFFSNSSFSGIWRYNIDEKTTQEITADGFSGFGFDINQAGDKIAYRRSTYQGLNRKQEIVEKNLNDNSTIVLETARSIATPVYYNEKVISSTNVASISSAPSVQAVIDDVKLLGIENTKIVIIKNGKKEILDPLGNGSYIWPSLSPDGKTIVAVDISRGTFLCTTDGTVTQMLGVRNAPAFTHDGKWIIYMVDIDDGHKMLNSDIYAVSADGQITTQLTNDNNINLNPVTSATENKIAFSTLDGELFILSYEETK